MKADTNLLTSNPQQYGGSSNLSTPRSKIQTLHRHMVCSNSIWRQFILTNNMHFNKHLQIKPNDIRHHNFLTRLNHSRFLNLNHNHHLNHNHPVHNLKYHNHVNRPKVEEKKSWSKNKKGSWI
jgi:hypothetical protein